MKKILCLSFCLMALFSSFAAESLDGVWSGMLDLGNIKLTLVMHIENTGPGLTPAVTLDSPDQGAKGIPTQVKHCSNDSIAIEVPQLGMSYAAKLQGDVLHGTFSQMDHKLPLLLSRGETQRNRPQTPQPPFPYTVQEITFPSIEKGITLAGSLTLPEDADLGTPIVVMVSGSGQQNRDEELFEHKPFAVLADSFARAGIASLRYDDRGVGGSTGDPSKCTTANFALDAEGAIKYLKSMGYTNVGILGHSEGGMISFITVNSDFKPNFIVAIGAPAVDGATLLTDQLLTKLEGFGLSPQQKENVSAVLSELFGTITAHPDMSEVQLSQVADDAMSASISKHTTLGSIDNMVLQSLRQTSLPGFLTPWMRYFLAYNPKEDIINANCVPSLAIYGGKDTQVSMKLNNKLMNEYLSSGKINTYPNLNHLMQPCSTGAAEEYAQIETTFAEPVIEDIITFIKSSSVRKQ